MSAAGPVRAAENTRDDWETPSILFEKLDAEFHFTLDGAANHDNHKCDRWYGPGQPPRDDMRPDFLTDAFVVLPWDERVFINPPYGAGLPNWAALFIDVWARGIWQRNSIVAVLPSSTGTDWFKAITESAHEVRHLHGRVPFVHAPHCACKACATGKRGSNTGDSSIAIWRPHRRPPGQAHTWTWDWRKS